MTRRLFSSSRHAGPRRSHGTTPGGPTRPAACRVAPMYHRNSTQAETLTIPAPGDELDPFQSYFRTESVALIYGTSRRLYADEHNHAGRLLKTLDRLGKEGIPIRGMIRGRTTLTHSSLRALNLYLRHCNGLTAFRRGHPHHKPLHRHGWHDLQTLLALRWTF
jgi:hypothetical protein